MIDIRLVKGSYDIRLFTEDVTESASNKLTVIPIPTTSGNQENGTKETKVVDLLRYTNTFHIICYITNEAPSDALDIKKNLVKLFKGAGVNGGAISLTYDGEVYSVFPEKYSINKLRVPLSLDNNSKNDAHYMVILDLVEGVAQ